MGFSPASTGTAPARESEESEEMLLARAVLMLYGVGSLSAQVPGNPGVWFRAVGKTGTGRGAGFVSPNPSSLLEEGSRDGVHSDAPRDAMRGGRGGPMIPITVYYGATVLGTAVRRIPRRDWERRHTLFSRVSSFLVSCGCQTPDGPLGGGRTACVGVVQ